MKNIRNNSHVWYTKGVASNERIQVGAWLSRLKLVFSQRNRFGSGPHHDRSGFLHFEDNEMAWLKLHQSVRHHRKIMLLSRRLKMKEPHAAGCMSYLWLWAIDNAPDGYLPEDVFIAETAAMWDGKEGAFIAAAVEVGLIDRVPDGRLCIHDWDEYTGALIEKRESAAERSRNWRKSKSTRTESVPNAYDTPQSREEQSTHDNGFKTSLNGRMEHSNGDADEVVAMLDDARAKKQRRVGAKAPSVDDRSPDLAHLYVDMP